MRALILLSVALAGCVSSAAAQDLRPERRLAELQFADIDEDDDGRLTAAEFMAYGDLVFVSMDSDKSRGLSEREFLDWGFGMHNVVDEAGVRQGDDTAVRVVFDLWDRDNDGAIDAPEQRDAHRMALGFADADADGRLDPAEFADNFILNIALRSALSATL